MRVNSSKKDSAFSFYNRLTGSASVLTLTLVGLSCAQPAAAQSDTNANEGQLQEIVVTAQKRSENLQNVPISVAAVSAQKLTSAGVVSTQGLSGAVAGLTVNQTSNYFSPHLRGVGSSFFGPGIENPVGLYVDGIYYGSQLMAPSNLSNVSQVSVLKGPQGTLFGRNSTGGVIQMTTRDPSSNLSGEVSSELDQYLTSRNFAYLTGGLSDNLKANISLNYTTQGEGWGKNLVTGNDIHKINHDFGVRSKWEWTPTAELSVKLNVDYSNRSDSLGQNVRPLVGYGQNLHGIASNSANIPPFLTGPNYQGQNFNSSNPYDSALNFDNRNRYEGGGAGLTVQYDLGFAKLVSITGYREYSFRSLSDTDESTDFSDDLDLNQHSKQFSQEIQLLSRDDPRFNWVVGAYYYNSKEALDPLIQNFGYFGPEFSQFGLANVQKSTYISNLSVTTKSLAFFGQATVELLENTRLTGGIRWTHERRSMSGFVGSVYTNYDGTIDTTVAPAFLDPGAAGVVNPLGTRLTKSQPTWRISLDHKFAPEILGYISYNRGYKSGGFNALLPITLPIGLPSTYQPEKVDAYEAGFKAQLFNRTLRINPAIFYNRYSDLQVLNLTNIFASVGNARKARMYGVDLDGEWQATPNLNFSFGAEWLNAKFTSFPGYPYVTPIPGGGVTGCPTDASGACIGDGKGKYIPFAPKFALNIGANYTLHVRDAKFDFNVSEAYNSGYYFESDNNVKQGSFSLLNASVMWTAPGDKLSISFWGRNLLDKAIPAQVSSAPAPSVGGVSADYTNPPRTYGATVRFKFGA